jgi:hypothetical protein
VLVGGVVGHPVDNDPHAALVGASQQVVEVGQGAEDRVDVGVVRDVVAEVGHGRPVERRQPDGGHPERAVGAVVQVVEVVVDTRQVTDTVLVAVREAAWVDLVDHPSLPPGELVLLHGHPPIVRRSRIQR